MPFLGIGLDVVFLVDEEGHRDATSPRERRHLRWRRRSDEASPPEATNVVAIGPAVGTVRRTVLHPVPQASALWGTLAIRDSLVVSHDDAPIGTARVVWLHELDQGLQPEELRALVAWANGGSTPSFTPR